MTIELAGIELHGFHGVLDRERREGQRFLVDLELDVIDETAAVTDRIADAVDYRDVMAVVVEVSDATAYPSPGGVRGQRSPRRFLPGFRSSELACGSGSPTSSWRGRSTTRRSSWRGASARPRRGCARRRP